MEGTSRRSFLGAVGAAAAARAALGSTADPRPAEGLDEAFLIKPSELTLRFSHPAGARRLSFSRFPGPPEKWREECRAKLEELLRLPAVSPGRVAELRHAEHRGVVVRALVMEVDASLFLPAYLLESKGGTKRPGRAVMAIQGHGEVEGVIGARQDYHHAFGLELAREGHLVLCPALRGFGPLRNMSAGDPARCLDYWDRDRGRQFTLVTDGFLMGFTLIGSTIGDLLRWERWLHDARGVEEVDAAGISYGGDLAFTYPVFSSRVRRIFSSGSLGSFESVFSRCYNAPAHCIPHVLEWMDRSDIAGLNAPRPIVAHFGELDTPGPGNNSAAYNETVGPSLAELRAIYGAFGAGDAVRRFVTPGKGHEMDIGALREFLVS